MKTTKITPVQYEMLVSLGKKWRMKPEDLAVELIEDNYNNKIKKKWFHALLFRILLLKIYKKIIPYPRVIPNPFL